MKSQDYCVGYLNSAGLQHGGGTWPMFGYRGAAEGLKS